MFRRRDIPPVLLLLLLIILVMLTLSQILVVHNGRYGNNAYNMRRLQLELREMDINLHSLMLRNVPSIDLNRRILQNQINAGRVKSILDEASHPDPHRRLLRRGRHEMAIQNSDLPETSHSSTRSNNQSKPYIPTNAQSLVLAAVNGTAVSVAPRSSNVALGTDTTKAGLRGGMDPTRVGVHGNAPTGASMSSSQIYSSLSSSLSSSSSGTSHANYSRRLYCPSIPPGLTGKVDIDIIEDALNYTSGKDILSANPEIKKGGVWRPLECVARHKVAVIIPYRDREEHLLILLSHLHPLLQRQQLDYTIYVVEQYGRDTFNKATIMNIAFVEALKLYSHQCFVFHDVDLVPEDDRNMYSCPVMPRHMSVAIDEMGYKLMYPELVGGVLSMRTEHFEKVNGYSNLYWGWGAEDDDMAYRIMHVGLKITRPPEGVARYKMVRHAKRKPADWRKRTKLLWTVTKRMQFDGLNSLQYRVVHIQRRPLFTHVLVDIGQPPKGF